MATHGYNRGDRRLLSVLAAAEGSAAIVCVLVILAAMIRHRPIPDPILDIPMVLLLLVGGVCAALVVSDRWRSSDGLHAASRRPNLSGIRWLIFGDLNPTLAAGLVVLGLGTFLAVQITVTPPYLSTDYGDASCPFQVLTAQRHDICVSESEYQLTGAAQQADNAALFVLLLVTELGVSWSGSSLRDKGVATPGSSPA